MHLFFNKNVQKVESNVSGRVREGFIVQIRWHPFNNLNLNLHSLNKLFIAYCFIMYCNTEVQIVATICNK